MRTTFRELQAAIYRQFEPQMEIHAYLHVLLSAQIKIGHATAWTRTRVCASFMHRPCFLSNLQRGLRASCARHSPRSRMTLPHRQVCEASREGTVNEAMALGIELSPSPLLKKKHRHSSAAIRWEIIADNLSKGRLKSLQVKRLDIRVHGKVHGSFKSLLCSCVSITLPASWYRYARTVIH